MPNNVVNPQHELENLELIFKSLAHPLRRQVLLVLHFRGGEMSSGLIAQRFDCAWPTTTRHLRLLESAGLVSTFQRGRERYYKLEKAHLVQQVGDWLNAFKMAPLV